MLACFCTAGRNARYSHFLSIIFIPDKMPEIQSAEQLKDDGNNSFQLGDYSKAIDEYTEALLLQPEKELKSILYRNRAMTRLKVEDYEGAEADCDKGNISVD